MKVNWRQMKVDWRMILGVSVAMLAALLAALPAYAGSADKKAAATENVPVTIIGVNAQSGVVTAKDSEGNTFTFSVRRGTEKNFKVGQKLGTRAFKKSVSMSGKLPHCDCGKMDDGKCWCSKCPGDLCFKIGCPYGDCRAKKEGELIGMGQPAEGLCQPIVEGEEDQGHQEESGGSSNSGGGAGQPGQRPSRDERGGARPERARIQPGPAGWTKIHGE